MSTEDNRQLPAPSEVTGAELIAPETVRTQASTELTKAQEGLTRSPRDARPPLPRETAHTIHLTLCQKVAMIPRRKHGFVRRLLKWMKGG